MRYSAFRHGDVILLIIWCIVIFIFSSIPNLATGLKEDFILRKFAHAGEYTLLVILFFNVFRRRINLKWFVYFASALYALAYAFTDEVHQTFVLGRSGNFFDIGIDSLSIVIGMVLISLVMLYREKNIPQ